MERRNACYTPGSFPILNLQDEREIQNKDTRNGEQN